MTEKVRAAFTAKAVVSAVDKESQPLPVSAQRFGLQQGIAMSGSHVILADSHFTMLEGMRRLIETLAKSVVMVADESSLIRAIHSIKPDLVIADLSFQVCGAANVVQLIKQHQPAVKVIVVSVYDDPALAAEAADTGAEGFVLKRRAVVDLVPAIDAVCQGRLYVSKNNFSNGKGNCP